VFDGLPWILTVSDIYYFFGHFNLRQTGKLQLVATATILFLVHSIGALCRIRKRTSRDQLQKLATRESLGLSRTPMATTKQKARQAITLKGSTHLVTEFFKYAVNT
jgi:hypothetical protein